MRVTLDWAVFATAPSQGHGLRKTSLERREVPAELSNFSDLPGGSEGAIGWVPYYAGRAFGGMFAFTYTSPDTSAGRAGRVQTRALLIPRVVAEQIVDIRSIFEALKEHPVFLAGGGAVELNISNTPIPGDEQVRQILSTFATYPEKRAVFVDQDRAERIIPAVWSALWPAARGSFSFRLHFDPYELPVSIEAPPLLVVTPSGTRRWTGGPAYAVVGAQPLDEILIINHLCGERRETAQEILGEIDTDDVRQLARLNNFMLDLEEAREQRTASHIAATLALLDVVALNPSYKERVRDELYGYLLTRLDDAEGNEVRRLAGIRISDKRVSLKVAKWARRLLHDLHAKNLVTATKRGQPWFRDAIRAGLEQAFPDPEQAERVWELWPLLDEEKLLDALSDPAWDGVLATNLPPQPPPTACDVAVSRGWWTLFTTLASQQEDDERALRDVLATVPETFAMGAATLLAELWGDRRFVRAVVRTGDPRAYEKGGQALARDPEILAELDVKNDAWLFVWTQALPMLPDIWLGVRDPSGEVFALLDRLQAKQSVPWDVLEAISRTDAADIIDYPNRSAVWSLVPLGFSDRTAHSLLMRDQDPGELEETLLNSAVTFLGEVSPRRLVASRILLQTKASLPERKLLQLLASIDELLSTHLLLLEDRFMSNPYLLSNLFDQGLTNEPRLPPVFLQHFGPWLSPSRQVRLAENQGYQVDADIWWRAVHELMSNLYSGGPHEVWETIGGKKKDLVQVGTGEQRWGDALRHMRERGKPSIGDLLWQAGRDYHLSDATSTLWRQRPE